jgi:hypothetical protein
MKCTDVIVLMRRRHVNSGDSPGRESRKVMKIFIALSDTRNTSPLKNLT